MDNLLILVRHGQSEWNEQNLFTGWRDPGLTEFGRQQAVDAGRAIRNLGVKTFNTSYTSTLCRAQHTLELIMRELGQMDLEPVIDSALNERDYGELSGLNKDEVRRRWGDEQVHLWRRSYDIAPPGGESLKDTAQRVIPFYERKILPSTIVSSGCKTIVAAHGNSLRALVMHLEGLSTQEVLACEIPTGVPIVYRLTDEGQIGSKQVLLTPSANS